MLARAVLGQSFAVEMRRSLGVVAVFSVCFATPARVRADTGSDPSPARIRQAAEAFDLGRDAYQREDFVEAAEQFERADSQAPSATAIEYAMRAREKAGELDRAATLAALALDRHAGDPSLAKLATELLNRAKPTLFALTVHCEEPCELAIESTIVHGAPSFSRVVFLKDGAALVHAGFQNGTSATRSITASRGEKGDLSFSVPAPSPPPSSAGSSSATGLGGPTQGPGAASSAGQPATRGAGPLLNGSSLEERPSNGLPPAVFWVGVGLTVAAGGVATWSGLDTLRDPGEARIHSECARGDTSCETYQLGIAKQRRTNILFGVTGGLGLGTILIGALFTDWQGGASSSGTGHALPPRHASGGSTARSKAPAWEPWFALGEGALAGARGRF